MSDRSYTTSNTKIIKELSFSSSWVLYIGRGITPSVLELEKLGGLDKRAIGNWETDVYGKNMTHNYHTCTSTQPFIPMVE